jgi:catechol 2,3-dioxygenase-like lactoylglutathione lyase family enzyme
MSKFTHMDSIFVPVTNVERSANWYEEVLGFTLKRADAIWKYYSLRINDSKESSTPWYTLYEVKAVQPGAHMPFIRRMGPPCIKPLRTKGSK